MNEKEFGHRLRQLREGSALSQKALAKRARVSAATISRIELGQSSPTLYTMMAISRALGLTVVGLIRDTKQSRPDELAELIRELPVRQQNLAYAIVGTMRVQLTIEES